MGGGEELGVFDQLQDNQSYSVSSGTVIQTVLSADLIMKNFVKRIFDDGRKESREKICEKTDLKILSEIQELQDLTIDDMQNSSNVNLYIQSSTQFNGNLYQILLDKGFKEDTLKFFPQEGVRIDLYEGTLKVFIKQPKLSPYEKK